MRRKSRTTLPILWLAPGTAACDTAVVIAVSLLSVLEAASRPDERGLIGDISDPEALLDPENLGMLEGVASMFAFLAFHPMADAPVREYIGSGALLADSGPNILVFFVLDEDASAPVPIGDGAFKSWVELSASSIPAYQLVRFLFEPAPVPPLPGLVFFSELARRGEAVYVPLADAAVQRTMRTAFSLADHAVRTKPRQEALDSLRVALRREKIKYMATTSMSLAEWLVRGYQYISSHAWDIVTLLKP